ncbi:hypothetical protein SAMN06295967_115100 [Belliella buryatensis]|uniref:Uncharacterized protein n=1 Tax=Belliella buryatensis TaxID=1500549 RepID=A0A239GEF2_9BACT|nr:hypothetical protein [Belliella buryatensis]SNS66853.1 hypothetical protein SAMN06295967_115100 [Belliella buryatensis]
MIVKEQQNLRGSFIMWAIILIELPTLALLLTFYFTGQLGEDGWVPILIVGGLMIGVFLFIFNMRLELRIDQYGISFRNPPIYNRWTKFKKEEIDTYELKKSDGLLEYGGVGIRFSLKTKAFIYFSDHILILEKENKKYVFSTHKQKEIQEILNSWKED